jgi:3-phenylpropionate/trans-cinnamate dioxygenase ferredoxin subunit
MDQKRREFCKLTGMTIAGAALLPATPGCGSGNSGNNAPILAGRSADLAVNDVIEVRVPDHNIDVLRDGKGIFAVDANCTHARCVLVFNAGPPPGLNCTCHGSTFDYNGQNPTPPATVPLAHYKVTVDASGNVFVDPGTTVDPATRVQG